MKSLDIRAGSKRPPRKVKGKGTGVFLRVNKILPASPLPPRRKRVWRKTFAGTASVVVLLVALFSFLILPEASIKATVRSEPVTRDFEIRVEQNQSTPNAAELVIPGKVLELMKEGTKSFAASGSRNIGRKASGFVHLYNFSKTTLILKAQTTVLEVQGRKYFFTQDVGNIRPTALIGLEEQEVDPTSLIAPVPVVADGPGEEFNLAKGTRLEVTNEAFGYQPRALYAVAAENLSGGTTEEVKIVTAGDLVQGLSTLARELAEAAKQDLLKDNPDQKFLDNALETTVLQEKASVNAGTEVGEFEVMVLLKLRALVYSEDEVRSVIKERISRLLPQNKILKTGKADIRLQSNFGSVDLTQGLGLLSNHFEGQIVYELPREELLEKVKGKTAAEIREILLSRPEIEKVEVKFYPFWVKKAPKFAKKIYLQVIEPTS